MKNNLTCPASDVEHSGGRTHASPAGQFYQHANAQLLYVQIPKPQKRLTASLYFLRFWDLQA